jgi:hypothetical protein
MKLSSDETARINKDLEKKRTTTCLTIDIAKQIELHVNGEIRARFRSLAEAKRSADVFLRRNPDMVVSVHEIKAKIHEFGIRE